MILQERPRIAIVGAGFGGLYAARLLTKHPVDIVLIDRNNFHTFTPLLYQVATCGLDPSEIAYPVRGIFRKNKNVRFLLGEVVDIDYASQQVIVHAHGSIYREPYDFLIIAAGTVTNFFGSKSLEQYAFGLKNLQDSVHLRNHILKLFEKAAWTKDSAEREALTTMVVVGGGPTGLETAGALYELYNDVLANEYNRANGIKARVILVEAAQRLLAPYPERLQKAALRQLESLGVEVILGAAVEEVGENHVKLSDGETIHTFTLVWAAGVKGSPAGGWLDVELQRGGRIPVKPTLEVIGRDRIYAVGDISYILGPDNQPYPQMIPVAQQQGSLAAKNIIRRLNAQAEQEFVYQDKGLMATIGRSRAVAYPYYKIQLTGYIAWVTWLTLHLIWLMGFRNRLNVFVNWVWNYFTYDRSVRIILERGRPESAAEIPQSERQSEHVEVQAT